MKKRKTLYEDNLEITSCQDSSDDNNQFFVGVLAVLCIVSFICGFLISWYCMNRPLSDNQLELCEQIARDMYAHEEDTITELFKDSSDSNPTITITCEPINDLYKCQIIAKLENAEPIKIIVEATSDLYRGMVIAKLQNGELVMTRDMETFQAIFCSILVGLVGTCLALVSLVIIIIIIAIKDGIVAEKKSEKKE